MRPLSSLKFSGRRALLVLLLAASAAPSLAQQPLPDPADPVNQIDSLTGKEKKKQKPPPVNLVVHVGHDNHVRKEQTAPVRVVLDNNDKAVSGHLELRDFSGHVSRMSYELPRGAHKEYTFFARLAPDANHSQSAAAEVLVLDGRRVLAKQTLFPKYLEEAPLILSVTDDGKNLLFINTDRREQFLNPGKHYQAAAVSPQDMPRQWPGLNPANVVAISGRSWSQLDDYQKKALRMWVEQGGRAILWGESTTEWRDPEGAALAAVQPRDLVSVTGLACIGVWGGYPYRAQSGKLLTVSGPVQPGGTVELREGDRPLVVTRRAHRGRVLWIGFDPLRETVRQWRGFPAFWKKALEEATSPLTAVESQPLENVDEARAAANALPRLPAPPLGAIVAFGVMYAFIFGPLNIWMLRRMRRTVRSWLFMPSLAATMTLVVLVIGQTWGSARTVLNSVSVLHTTAGARTASEESLIGLFSPTNRAFDITVEDPAPGFRDAGGADGVDVGSGIQLHWPDHQNEGVVRWSAVALQLYSTRVLAETRPRDLGGSIEVALSDGPRLGGALEGTVRNGTNLALKDAYLQRRGRFYMLGDLPVGKAIPVKAAGWSKKAPQGPARPAAAGELQENRQFRDSIERLWATTPAALHPERSRDDTWLVAECADYVGALEVAHVPYNNRAGLLVVRVPEGSGPRSARSIPSPADREVAERESAMRRMAAARSRAIQARVR